MQGLPSAATPPPFAAPGGYQAPQVCSRTDPHYALHTQGGSGSLVRRRYQWRRDRPALQAEAEVGEGQARFMDALLPTFYIICVC